MKILIQILDQVKSSQRVLERLTKNQLIKSYFGGSIVSAENLILYTLCRTLGRPTCTSTQKHKILYYMAIQRILETQNPLLRGDSEGTLNATIATIAHHDLYERHHITLSHTAAHS